VRFETSLGDFDMVLNPTNNPRLQAHVDNMLQYVEGGFYGSSWINRADEGFVLQMGGFFSDTKRPPMTLASTRPVPTFAPVPGEPASTFTGLSNTAGTVALALPGGAGGTNQDGGTSSFFINLGSNTQLDQDFTVFAAVPDMTVVNQIMALMQVDRTTDPIFGAGPGNLAFTDVPVQANGQQVFILRAFVVDDAMSIARAMGGVESVLAQSAASFQDGSEAAPLLSTIATAAPLSDAGSSASALGTITVPEPATATGAIIGALLAAYLSARQRLR
jgi:cyclophilin family peptidyl-prolyl cis-trans isomerase